MNLFLLAKRPACITLLFSLLLLLAFSAHAEEPLTLAETIKLATENQPLLQSLDDAANSSRQAAVAEGQLADPKLKLGVVNLPVTTADALRFNRDDQTAINVGISQDIIPLKKRELASKRMEAEADQFHTEQISTARSIERDVALVWLDLFEAQRKFELYQKMMGEMTAERKVLISRISSNGAQTSEVLKLDSKLSMTTDKYLTAQRDVKKAKANLARWIGQAAMRPIATELPVMGNRLSHQDALLEIEKHPLLQNAHLSEKIAQLDVDKAQADIQRNWGWEAAYGKRFADRSDMLSFQISMDLQLDRYNRQDRRTAEKLVLVEKSHKLTEDRRRELSSALDNALADAELAEARENEHATRLIPNAEAMLKIAQAAYTSGKQALSEVWEARRSLIEVEIDHWAILTDQQRATVQIAYLVNDHRLFKEN
jgi:outer membrane protein TolC